MDRNIQALHELYNEARISDEQDLKDYLRRLRLMLDEKDECAGCLIYGQKPGALCSWYYGELCSFFKKKKEDNRELRNEIGNKTA